MFIRAKAQMLKTGAAPTWDFSVRNNTNSDALYALDGSAFNSGSANSTRNLRATTGWGGTSYTGTRAAAPFAILDTVYRAKELILTAAPTATFVPIEFVLEHSEPAGGPVLSRRRQHRHRRAMSVRIAARTMSMAATVQARTASMSWASSLAAATRTNSTNM